MIVLTVERPPPRPTQSTKSHRKVRLELVFFPFFFLVISFFRGLVGLGVTAFVRLLQFYRSLIIFSNVTKLEIAYTLFIVVCT